MELTSLACHVVLAGAGRDRLMSGIYNWIGMYVLYICLYICIFVHLLYCMEVLCEVR